MPTIELKDGMEYVLAPNVWQHVGLLENLLEMDLTPASRKWVITALREIRQDDPDKPTCH